MKIPPHIQRINLTAKKIIGSVYTVPVVPINSLYTGCVIVLLLIYHMSHVLENLLFAYVKIKAQAVVTAQLINACFRFVDSIIPLLPKSEISRLYPSSVVARPGLCRTWSETLKTGFLMTRLIMKVTHKQHSKD